MFFWNKAKIMIIPKDEWSLAAMWATLSDLADRGKVTLQLFRNYIDVAKAYYELDQLVQAGRTPQISPQHMIGLYNKFYTKAKENDTWLLSRWQVEREKLHCDEFIEQLSRLEDSIDSAF